MTVKKDLLVITASNGENLKLAEDYWINNNFKISDKELEKIVKN